MMANETNFNGKSVVYSKFRPDYPDQLLKNLITDNNLHQNSVVADIGSGTGIMTKKLLEFGFKVFAVEPNDEMRVAASDNLKDYKQLILVNGSAENTTLKDNSVDIIVVAQAFHWFDAVSFRKECQRLLKPGGKVVIISNERVAEDKINKEIAEVYRKYCPNFKGFSNGMMETVGIYENFFEEGYTFKSYGNPLIYNQSSFIGRHLSSSFSLTKEDELYSKLVEALSNIFERNSENGVLTLPNITKYRCGVVKES